MNIMIAVAYVISVVALYFIGRSLFRGSSGDKVIDDLIAKKGFRPVKGMEKVDYEIINRKGNTNWQTVMQAQENLSSKAAV